MDDAKDHDGSAEAEHAAAHDSGVGEGSAPFTWSGLAAWSADAFILGSLAAWLAFTAQTSLGFAPLLLFPAIVGALLGALLAGARLLTPIGHRRTVLLGTLLAVVVAVAGQHVLCYRAALEHEDNDQKTLELAEAAFPELAEKYLPGQRLTFWSFMQDQATGGRPIGNWFTLRGPAVWISWVVDAAILGAAVVFSNTTLFRQFRTRRIPEENTPS